MTKYMQYFFDCDGVLLDSNHIKSEAFYNVAKIYSKDHADDFLAYHKKHGGISRFEKFNYFFKEMLQKKNIENEIKDSLIKFKELTHIGLINCKIIDGVYEYLESIPKHTKKYVVSGGLESELKDILKIKKLDLFFDGIYGSPKSKYEIMTLLYDKNLKSVFFGDSKLDYEVATHFNCDFYFIYGHTEFKEYSHFFADKSIEMKKDFKQLLP